MYGQKPNQFFVAVVLNFLFISLCSAANFYVRQGASGANNGGDWANAWGSMSNINYAALRAGDIVYIAAGTYGSLVIEKSGAAGSPLTFKRATAATHGTDTGWQASYDARVIIDGGGSECAVCLGGSVQAHYVTIDGATRYGMWVRNAKYGVKPYGPGSSNNAANNLTIRHLEIGDAGSYKLGEDCIQGIGNNLLVEYNYCHDADDNGTHGDGIQWFEGNGVVIRYNVFKNTGQIVMMGCVCWGSVVNDVEIYYNVFYNRGGDHYNGMVFDTGSPASGRYVKVYNNTFDLEVHDTSGRNNIFNLVRPAGTVNFKNNAVVYSNAGSVNAASHSYNAFDNSAPYLVYEIPAETGRVVAADLGFVNIGAADYHLTAGSPLIGKGTNVGLTQDFDGKAVPATPSIGAFEYGSVSVTTTTSGTTTTTNSQSTTTLAPPATGQSLFTTQVPQLLSNTDGAGVNYELGMRFTATTAGQLKAIRFYKSPSETGQHTGKIYAANGQVLASVTFTNETASGWQVQNLATPLNIAANTEYTVSVNTGNSFYVATNGGLSTQVYNGALRSVGGGVYGPVGSKPTQTWQSSNYFRDIVFTPNPTGQSLFTTQVPQLLSNSDGATTNYELGMRFKATKAGQLKAIRFYKSASESGQHTGKIYSSSGQLLASVNFSSETGSGWQVQSLTTPLTIEANTEYTVTVNTGSSYYVATNNGLATPVTNGSLTSFGGGVFGKVGSKPTQTWQSSNYFRDVVFLPFSY